MMAAGRAAELGAGVLLFEKMERPGKKLLISGNGHCNLSNSRDIDSFIAQFGPNGCFLSNAFKRFFRDDLLALLRRYGVECKIKPSGKIYPISENARDIVRAFQRYLADGKVNLQFNAGVTGVLVENGRVTGVSTAAGNLPASAVILAAGGSSHPQTGSTGDGFDIAAALGHAIVRTRPGLVPLVVADIEKVQSMQCASLRNVRVTAFQCSSEQIDVSMVPRADVGRGIAGDGPELPVIESRTGNASIVYFGLSGTVILEISLAVVDALQNGPVSLSIDLVSDRNIDRLNPLKSLRFDIKGPHSMSTAIVTAGGISLKEINPLTMESKLVGGLYFCGEVMDVDAGTGGYNLQAAFSTGYLAGESAASASIH